jgi:hypothetical protein
VPRDPRPTGILRTVMRSPQGQEFPNTGCYLEVEITATSASFVLVGIAIGVLTLSLQSVDRPFNEDETHRPVFVGGVTFEKATHVSYSVRTPPERVTGRHRLPTSVRPPSRMPRCPGGHETRRILSVVHFTLAGRRGV